jgi:hypothetical protein
MRRAKSAKKPEKPSWSFRDVYIIACVLVAVGFLFLGFGSLMYYGGVPEHMSHSRLGSTYVPEQPPGQPKSKAPMVSGAILTGAGLVVGAATGIAQLRHRTLKPRE